MPLRRIAVIMPWLQVCLRGLERYVQKRGSGQEGRNSQVAVTTSGLTSTTWLLLKYRSPNDIGDCGNAEGWSRQIQRLRGSRSLQQCL